jgi:hypothetical protein
MADEVLRRAARAITDLRELAKVLNDACYPGSAIRLQGFAGLLKRLDGELVQTLPPKIAAPEIAYFDAFHSNLSPSNQTSMQRLLRGCGGLLAKSIAVLSLSIVSAGEPAIRAYFFGRAQR